MATFTVSVNCASGTTPHQHLLTVESGDRSFGVAPTTQVRLQYTCPLTGQAAIAAFLPPAEALRPYKIMAINDA